MERSWQGRTLLLPIPPPGCCLLAAHWPASLSCIEPEAGGAALQRRPWGRGQHQEVSERLMSPLPSRKSSRPSKPGGRLGSEPSGQVLARRTRSSLNRVPWQVPGQTLTPRPRQQRLSALAAAGMRFPCGRFCCLTSIVPSAALLMGTQPRFRVGVGSGEMRSEADLHLSVGH